MEYETPEEKEFSRDLVSNWVHSKNIYIYESLLPKSWGIKYKSFLNWINNEKFFTTIKVLKKIHLSPTQDAKLKLYISFLKECRPHSVSMGNAIRTIKSKVQFFKVSETAAFFEAQQTTSYC